MHVPLQDTMCFLYTRKETNPVTLFSKFYFLSSTIIKLQLIYISISHDPDANQHIRFSLSPRYFTEKDPKI